MNNWIVFIYYPIAIWSILNLSEILSEALSDACDPWAYLLGAVGEYLV